MNDALLLCFSSGIDQTPAHYFESLRVIAALTGARILLLMPKSKSEFQTSGLSGVKVEGLDGFYSAALDDFAREPQRLAYVIAAEVSVLGPVRAILAPHTAYWLRLLSFLSSAFDLPFYSNLIGSELPQFARRICAGKYLELRRPPNGVFCATIDASAVNTQVASVLWQGKASVLSLPADAELPIFAKLLDFMSNASSGPQLSTAELIFAGGRGLASRQNFEKLKQCAEKYGAGLAGTRHAVDLGWCPAEAQVGQTGQSVAPKRYVAFGISGAIQHWAGIVNAQEIFAINTDPAAPIFRRAQVGHIGDALAIIDRLLEAKG